MDAFGAAARGGQDGRDPIAATNHIARFFFRLAAGAFESRLGCRGGRRLLLDHAGGQLEEPGIAW